MTAGAESEVVGVLAVADAGPRVLVVPPSYFARDRVVGGGERYAMEYARALARLTPTTLGLFDLEARLERNGPLEIRTFTVRNFDQRRGFPATWETLRAIGEYDVLHLQVFPTPMSDLLVLAGRARGQTVVLTDVGGGGSCWSTYLGRVHPRLNINRLAHGLAFLSPYASRFFARWPQPSTVLGGGVNLSEFSAGHEPQGYALFVGRLLPHKGVLQLVEAVSPGTPLRIVGRPYDAGYRRRLEEAARGKSVRFFFDADDEELREHYRGASVVLQPSLPSGDVATDKSELLGLVALEAMASGKPVIVTRTTSLPDLVVHGETGFVVDAYDPRALRDAIDGFVRDAEQSRRMGAAARRRVEEHFTWDRVAERGLHLYLRLDAPRRT